jgi:hypothetical protein
MLARSVSKGKMEESDVSDHANNLGCSIGIDKFHFNLQLSGSQEQVKCLVREMIYHYEVSCQYGLRPDGDHLVCTLGINHNDAKSIETALWFLQNFCDVENKLSRATANCSVLKTYVRALDVNTPETRKMETLGEVLERVMDQVNARREEAVEIKYTDVEKLRFSRVPRKLWTQGEEAAHAALCERERFNNTYWGMFVNTMPTAVQQAMGYGDKEEERQEAGNRMM